MRKAMPIRGAVVTARWGEATNATGAYGTSRSAVTNAEGVYSIHGLEPGVHDVEARAQDHAPWLQRGLELGTDVREQDFVLSGGMAIEGRVVDSLGLAAADAEVFAFVTEPCDLSGNAKTSHLREDRRERKGGMATARTDEHGRYRLSHLPEEEITLVARAPLSQPSELQVVRLGEKPADLVIVRLSSFAGVVVDSETGGPVPWFQVHMRIQTGGGDRDLIPREFSGSVGRLPHRRALSGPGHGGRARPRLQHLVPGSRARGGSRDGHPRRMDRGKTLQGTVLDSKTNLPVAFARVSCQPRGDLSGKLVTAISSLEWADTAGVFAVPGLEPGKYWVHVHHPEYQQETDGIKATIADDVNEPLMHPHDPGRRPRGPHLEPQWVEELRHAARARAPGGDGGREHWVRVEHDGTFHATSIRPGRYRVSLKERFFKEQPEAGRPILPRTSEEKLTPLGEVEIAAGQTATFEARAP